MDDGAVSSACDARTGANTELFLWIEERLAGISPVGHTPAGVDRQILALAVPALGALVCLILVVVRVGTGDWRAPAIAGVLLLGAVLIYALVRPKVTPAAPSP